MKKNYGFFLLFLAFKCLAQTPSGPLSGNGLPVSSLPMLSGPFQPPGTSTLEYEDVRVLTEVNEPFYADAYPWISADGLRVYYTMDDNSPQTLRLIQRSTTSSFFDPPITVPVGVDFGRSYWFSKNELELYISNSSTLFYTKRSALNAPFDPPIPINLIGSLGGFISGQSLNEAQDELYLYCSDVVTDLRVFRKTNSFEFTLERHLVFPPSHVANPAQLSLDNLNLLFSLSDPNNYTNIYQMTRPTPADTFDLNTLALVQGVISMDYQSIQPAVSDSLHWMVFVRSQGQWDKDDLVIAKLKSNSSGSQTPAAPRFDFSIFPNPATNELWVQMPEMPSAMAQLFALDGSIQKQWTVNPGTAAVSVSELPAGIYTLKITGASGSMAKKWVKI